jgi:hypothetical protein
MRKYFLVLIFNFAISILTLAQSTEEGIVTGIVTDLSTGKPMEFVNVFIANTMRGVMTDAQGSFTLDKIPFGAQEIVCSFVGYEPYRSQVKITSQVAKLTIKLQPKTTELAGVEIKGEVDKVWKKQMKKFRHFFLGNTSNADDCIIVNAGVIDFWEDEKTKSLWAKASDLLVIENRALGYKITYLLEDFEVDKRGNSRYFGKPKFDFLEPKDEREKKRWEVARVDTYRGSVKHFLHALITDSLVGQSFEVFTSPIFGKDERPLQATEDIWLYGESSSQRLLKFKNYLKIVYNNRVERQIGNRTIPQTCWIKMTQTAPAMFYTNGYLSNPLAIFLSGYWAKMGMADELPFEYVPPKF